MDVYGTLVIGSRASRLATVQAEWVKGRLETVYPSQAVTIKTVKTTGDRVHDVALDKIGAKGLFTKELERELVVGTIDLAVHSMKDVPTALPDGLTIGAVTRREDAHDALVSREAADLGSMPPRARIGTGSLRRKAQILHARPDLDVLNLRGNLDTRLEKLDRGEFDAIVVACAGMRRIGKAERISQVIPYSVMLPAVGQGALAVEIRDEADRRVAEMVGSLDDDATAVCVTAERAMLARLGGGCHVPIGAIAEVERGTVRITGAVAALDGCKVFRTEARGSAGEAVEVGTRAAEQLLAMGADGLLDEIGT